MKAAIRKGLSSSYAMHREYRLLRLSVDALRRRERMPILVYQMGKVGSTAVSHALGRECPGRPVYHLHTLRRDRLGREERLYASNFRERRRIDGHVLHSLFVRRRLAGWPPRPRRWKIVTLVRDPVQRNVSSFFQTLDLHFAELGFAERIRREDETVVADLASFFLESFPHERILSWFDDEIRNFFDIDVLAGRFPHDRGYRVYSAPRADVLLIRLEDLDQAVPEAFRDLLGIEDSELVERNVASDKYYADTYRRFIDEVRFPKPLLDRIYGSKMVRTLYTPREIAAFRARWRTI